MAQQIELSTYNPYALSRQIIEQIDGNTELYRNPIVYSNTDQDFLYIIRQDDTLDSIANLFYANVQSNYFRWAWIILDANPNIITDPFNLPFGTEIRIPYVKSLQWRR